MTDAGERAAELAERARRDREAFDRPADPPAEERAMEYLREGVGQVVALYVEARTGEGSPGRFSAVEFSLLERALNDWLELYAACYDVDIEANYTVREAAELLVETHDVRDVAQLLTHVPDRRRADAG